MQNSFRYFNSSPEVIRLAAMMSVRYPLSLRQVEDLLVERGIDVCHETVRFWWNRFGPPFAGEIGRRRVARRNWSNWRWHLDEVFVRIDGETYYLWRAMKRYGRPASIVTDRLRSYRAAMNVIGNAAAQTCGRWLNNRAENSHRPFRRREGAMARFRGHRDPAEIRLRPRLDPQPFQPRPSSQPPRYFQTRPSRRLGRVASTCSLRGLDCRFFRPDPVTLTTPQDTIVAP